MALNLFTGERWAYATFLMYVMMQEYGICPAFFWYVQPCVPHMFVNNSLLAPPINSEG